MRLPGRCRQCCFHRRRPLTKTLDYARACIQALHVGGDYFDLLDLGHNQPGLVLADIAGKGIAAALLMANLPATLPQPGRNRL